MCHIPEGGVREGSNSEGLERVGWGGVAGEDPPNKGVGRASNEQCAFADNEMLQETVATVRTTEGTDVSKVGKKKEP